MKFFLFCLIPILCARTRQTELNFSLIEKALLLDVKSLSETELEQAYMFIRFLSSEIPSIQEKLDLKLNELEKLIFLNESTYLDQIDVLNQ